MAYAVFQTGTNQYKVMAGETFQVEKIVVPEGTEVVFDKVLLAVDDQQKGEVGTPYLEGRKVLCEVVGLIKAPKVLAFKFRPKKHSKQLKGHRQKYTVLKVKEII
jgi:large subunit ribosomal protein L21